MRLRGTHVILAIVSILVGLSLAATTSATSPASHEDDLLRKATVVFEHMVEPPAAAIPTAVLMRATAIAVIPAAVKDGTRFHGDGVVSARGGGALTIGHLPLLSPLKVRSTRIRDRHRRSDSRGADATRP